MEKIADVTVAHVLEAASEVTGTPVRLLASRSFAEPIATHRQCARAAARRLLDSRRLVASGVRWDLAYRAPLRRAADEHAQKVSAIEARAIELAETGGGLDMGTLMRTPSVETLLQATSDITGESPRTLTQRTRYQPWCRYYVCTVLAGRQLGIGATALGIAFARTHSSISNISSVSPIEREYTGLVAQIVARVREIDAGTAGPPRREWRVAGAPTRVPTTADRQVTHVRA